LGSEPGDTIIVEMEKGRHVGGWFEVKPPVESIVYLNGNGAVIDVSKGRFDDDGNAQAYATGTEGQAVVVPVPLVKEFHVKDLTIVSWQAKSSRCLRLNGQDIYTVDNVICDAVQHGLQGAGGDVRITNSIFLNAGRGAGSGLTHALYSDSKSLLVENTSINTVNGHGIKAGGANIIVRGNVITEGGGNTGGALNWFTGEGTYLLEGNMITQEPSTGNRAIISLSGNKARWIGGGELIMKDNTIIDKDPKGSVEKMFQWNDTVKGRVKIVDGGGNTYNGEPMTF
jgi:hypothetical protein